MSNERILFSTGFVSLKESSRGFQFLERQGKDSVAIFLIRKSPLEANQYEVLIRNQPLCIDNVEVNGELKLYSCPLTGGIDQGESPAAAAKRETYEESGFSVEVLPLGSYIVGTQTNEICHMYYADVTELEQQTATQDGSYFEAVSKNEWHPLEYLNKCDYVACQLGYFRLKAVLSEEKIVTCLLL